MTLSDLTKYSVTRSVTRSLGQLSFLFYMVQCVLYFLYFFDCPVNSCIFRKCPVFLLTWQIIAVPFCDIVYILQECACFSCCFSFLWALCKLPLLLSADEVSEAVDQWKMLALDSTPPEWKCDSRKVHPAIDEVWRHVLSQRNAVGNLKYCTLAKVVKACLAFPHGNADAERSFSANLLLLVCVSFTIIGQPRNSVLIRRV